MRSDIIEADLTWIDHRFETGVRVTVTGDKITAITRDGVPTRRLRGRALLPGFVNAHSHAFQRGLRGLGEHYPEGFGDFWSWREAMYTLVEELTPDRLRRLCLLAFEEMLAAGVTTVGEFHYIRHLDAEQRDFAFDEIVLQAAAEAGIRIALLPCLYTTGGFDRPLAGGQLRFATPELDAALRQMDRLETQLNAVTQTIGIAPHSLRAVPSDMAKACFVAAADRDWVVHMHVEEQQREIDDCVAALGVRPMRWLLDNIDLNHRFTAIHATHTTDDDLAALSQRSGNVCVCPITEGNLGDGIANMRKMLERPDSVCVGSDSNIRIDFAEEARQMEYSQRLRDQRRGRLIDANGHTAPLLLDCVTENGARALNIPTGQIETGHYADFATIDLEHPHLAETNPDALAAAFVFGAGAECVREVCVGGVWR
ncbi:MAG: formimidoylglutamate deiminase [Phycisphaerales bacterium]|nr:formimidoylglutamate deiminase [Phycisphaerales bacterium]